MLKKHLLLLSVLKTVVLLNIFVETYMFYRIIIFFDEKKVQKNKIVLK